MPKGSVPAFERHRPANRQEKGMIRKIARMLPEIVIPIGIGEFEESKETPGEMIPVVEMGRVVYKGHVANLYTAFEEQGLKGVDQYVKGVYERHEENKKQFEAANTDKVQ